MKKILLFIAIGVLLLPAASNFNVTVNDVHTEIQEEKFEEREMGENDTEYWALLIAVGKYANVPEMDRPSMLIEVENFYNTLLVSERWKEDHIKVLTAENATVFNILAAFKWLDEMDDENDFCLVYITTHGFPILFDLPPFDEDDGMDEALATYRGFLPFPNPWSWEPLANPFAILTDDLLNFLLNRLEAKGICFIVDSCHSGGFNDNWSYVKANNFAVELAKDLRGGNRIVMTSVREEDLSYGSIFTHFIVEGLKGYADSNNDGICTAEEAFYYAKPRVMEASGYSMVPQIFDDYEGEMPLTERELPPSKPVIGGVEIGDANVTMLYTFYSTDPEGDRIKYHIKWGDGSEEYTSFYNSGEKVNVTHVWTKEGTYEIEVEAIDEHGAVGEKSYKIVTMQGKYSVDQRQVDMKYAYLVNDTRWLAQSFVPSMPVLGKVELCLICWADGYDLELSIREEIDGNDLVKVTKTITPTDEWKVQWVMFSFDEINVTPGKEYYIVCRSSKSGWGVAWVVGGNEYGKGMFYTSSNAGNEWWKVEDIDACFVTYGSS